MLPTLGPGALVVALPVSGARSPRPGDIVLAERPSTGLVLVKRCVSVDARGAARLVGDNRGESTDGRHFGLVDAGAIRGIVVGSLA